MKSHEDLPCFSRMAPQLRSRRAKTVQEATIQYIQPETTSFEFLGPHGSIFTVLGLPATVIALYFLCSDDGCPASSETIWHNMNVTSFFDSNAFTVYFAWMAYHVFMAIFAPGTKVLGSELPNGKRLEYKLNGLTTLLSTLGMVAFSVHKNGMAPLLWIADNYFQLSFAGIVFCFALSTVLYLSSFRSDQVIVAKGGNSGYHIYDFWMGRELNPRILDGLVDLKFVCELRPGLIGWLIINLAFAAKQINTIGKITNSMIFVVLGQGYYVIDALLNEKAILTTMDITTDGFGYL